MSDLIRTVVAAPMLVPSETVYVIESSDFGVRDDEGNPIFSTALPDSPHLVAAVERLESEFDSLSCESLACSLAEGEGSSANPVGWVLTEREDTYGAEHASVEFRYTAVVVTPTGSWLMCEDCHCAHEFSPGGAAHQRLKEGA